jgi:hypothetical protein
MRKSSSWQAHNLQDSLRNGKISTTSKPNPIHWSFVSTNIIQHWQMHQAWTYQLDLKRNWGWKSSSVAEGYIAESLTNKIEVADKILHENSVHMMQKTRTIQETGVIDVTVVETEKGMTISTPIPLMEKVNIEKAPSNISGSYTNCNFTFNMNVFVRHCQNLSIFSCVNGYCSM